MENCGRRNADENLRDEEMPDKGLSLNHVGLDHDFRRRFNFGWWKANQTCRDIKRKNTSCRYWYYDALAFHTLHFYCWLNVSDGETTEIKEIICLISVAYVSILWPVTYLFRATYLFYSINSLCLYFSNNVMVPFHSLHRGFLLPIERIKWSNERTREIKPGIVINTLSKWIFHNHHQVCVNLLILNMCMLILISKMFLMW